MPLFSHSVGFDHIATERVLSFLCYLEGYSLISWPSTAHVQSKGIPEGVTLGLSVCGR